MKWKALHCAITPHLMIVVVWKFVWRMPRYTKSFCLSQKYVCWARNVSLSAQNLLGRRIQGSGSSILHYTTFGVYRIHRNCNILWKFSKVTLVVENWNGKIYHDFITINPALVSASPCKNGGVCNTDLKKSLCTCNKGYLGQTCDIPVCKSDSCIHGTCSVSSNNLPQCR